MDVMTDYRAAAENAPFYYTVSPWLRNFWCLKINECHIQVIKAIL